MKVKFVSNKSYPEFEVYDETKMVIHIKIDPEIQAFRIRCQDNRRVFSIATEVVKKNKITTLLNEYSQQLGSLIKSKPDNTTGEIEIEGVHYTFKLNNDFLKEIHLFEDNNYQPVLSCKLEMGQLSFLHEDYISYLLFSLVWFKFLTQEQATFVQFAEA
jgi:hypothetical protein